MVGTMASTAASGSVPKKLQELVKLIMRGFYQPEQVIIVDYLIKNPCMKEDDIIQLLRFEKKQLRLYLALLKNDRFLKEKLRVETTDGKAAKHNYYYLDYHTFINVIKYKLLMMQRKIESQARDATNRAKYVCVGCGRTYNELDIGQIYDPMMNEMKCVICAQPVEEDESTDIHQDLSLSVRFHEQLKKVFDLLDVVEREGLPNKISEPQFNDMTNLLNRLNNSGAGQQQQAGAGDAGADGSMSSADDTGDNVVWSGDRHRGYNLYGEQSGVHVSIEGSEGSAAGVGEGVSAVRELPAWLTHSTVTGMEQLQEAMIWEAASRSTSHPYPHPHHPPTFHTPRGGNTSNIYPRASLQDIEHLLLIHENKVNLTQQNSDSSSSTSKHNASAVGATGHSYEKSFNSGSGNTPGRRRTDITDKVYLYISNQRIPLSDVTDDIVSRMSDKERQEFVRLAQQLYFTLFD